MTTTARFVDEGHAVTKIAADELKAQIGGKPATIVAVNPAPKPEIVLLIDASSSIKGVWNESIAAAKQFAAAADNGLATVVFRDKILAVAENRSETDKLLEQLPSLTPSPGGTALYETLVAVAGKVKSGDAALVMIGDGEDNMSSYSSDQVASMFLRSSWPPVFGLVLDYDHEQKRRGYFKKIASETGGLMVVPSSAAKVPESEMELASEVFAPLRVTLKPQQPIPKPAKLKLDVIGPGHEIHVAYPAEVVGCDSSAAGTPQ